MLGSKAQQEMAYGESNGKSSAFQSTLRFLYCIILFPSSDHLTINSQVTAD